jgi:hypothetical protein
MFIEDFLDGVHLLGRLIGQVAMLSPRLSHPKCL